MNDKLQWILQVNMFVTYVSKSKDGISDGTDVETINDDQDHSLEVLA